MAYDEGLALRVEEILKYRSDLVIKKMFGGLCFLLSGNIACGIVGEQLMARVGKEQYDECLTEEHASQMDLTGRAMKGFIYVSPEGIESDEALEKWISRCESFVDTLPPK